MDHHLQASVLTDGNDVRHGGLVKLRDTLASVLHPKRVVLALTQLVKRQDISPADSQLANAPCV